MKKTKKDGKSAKSEPHACPVCGKMTTNPKMCSRGCYTASLKLNGTTSTLKLGALDNTNRCRQCGCVMPTDRYSMYCEACEMLIIED